MFTDKRELLKEKLYTKASELLKRHGPDYDKIRMMNSPSEEFSRQTLELENDTLRTNVTYEEWCKIVKETVDSYNTYSNIVERKIVKPITFSKGESNGLGVPNQRKSVWQQFKTHKLKDDMDFNEETVLSIEKDTSEVLKGLRLDTQSRTPVKGLVIGGVQSGKTTNMASLMAMSSDYGFNVFIILSGTIENLRLQTHERMKSLFDNLRTSNDFYSVDRPENSYERKESLSSVYRENRVLYMTVLKQKDRLQKLITWLTTDKNLMDKLRIVVIDDEADQASINTGKIDLIEERKTINDLIVKLTQGMDIKGNKVSPGYKSMNYVAYTATPYANLLNEMPSDESLYPQDFITILSESPNHFGPREIFGILGEEIDELSIVKTVSNLDSFKLYLSGDMETLPLDLKESIGYFISASASLREHKFKKPVSMLVHLSHRVAEHEIILNSIRKWLTEDKEEVIKYAEKAWNNNLDNNLLDELMRRIKLNPNTTLKPHSFEDIKLSVKEIIDVVGPMKKSIDNSSLIYHNGIHLVMDNSESKSYGSNDEEYKLIYPYTKNDKNKTPIFLIIGGATLSRGLTIEGLVTSIFIRTPGSADTLTQMGRWFGYRVNYELYPRIWVTDKTKEIFKYVSTVETELREELNEMNTRGIDLEKIGPRIRYSPHYINITQRNKRQSMVEAEYDFSGFNTQTYIFDNDVEIQKNNVEVTENFINSLGMPNIVDQGNTDGIFWTNVSFDKINEMLLSKFSFNNRIKSLSNIDALTSWIKQVSKDGGLTSWNVILGTKGRAGNATEKNMWNLNEFSVNKVERTKKVANVSYDDEINIGVLRAPSDLHSDLTLEQRNDPNVSSKINDSSEFGRKANYNFVRSYYGLDRTPQLFIYNIDKNSKPKSNKRDYLGIDSDIIGLFIIIPSDNNNKGFVTKVQIRRNSDYLDEYFDESGEYDNED